MANNTKKYVSLTRLSNFLDNIKAKYSQIGHKHTISDISNYTVDSSLSSTSTNPVQNKVLDAEFEAMATAMGALESVIDGKANSAHTHDDRYYTETEIDEKLDAHTTNSDIHFTAAERNKLSGIAAGAQVNTVNGVKGSSESTYRTGNINITKANIGLGNVDNTADSAKSVKHATSSDSATSATKATQDASGNVITSTYETKTDADAKLDSAKSYTDTKTANLASTTVVDNKITSHNTATTAHSDIRDLISGLTNRLNTLANSDDTTLDQMSEVVAYIKNNKSLIDGITTNKVNVADIVNNLTTNVTNKPLSAAQGVAIKVLIDGLQEELDSHSHAIADVSGLQSALDGKASTSHGTHVSFSSTAPVMDGTASVGSASTVARSDHRHPTDTSRAAKTDLDSHTGNTTVHITATERTNWNAAKTHADSAHAPSNAEKNQNAFSNIAVSGQTTVAADSATDTVTFVGSNVSITTDATNDKVTFSVANGSTSAKGVVQLTNSTSSTSTTTAATPNSVKSAYDLANTAKTKADSAYTLAESKVDSLSDLGVTVTADELNYLNGAIGNIQRQLDERRTHWVDYDGWSLTTETVSDGDTLDVVPSYTPVDYIIVVLDDVEYRCRMWTNNLGEKCYGDSRITTRYDYWQGDIPDDTNPESTPFYINCCADDDDLGNQSWTWTILFNSSISSSKHAIEIYPVMYHTLSENFIPDTIARKSDVSQVQIITWEAND